MRQILSTRITLTTRSEAAEIESYVDEVIALLPPEDAIVLGADAWKRGLMRGIAAHHAGMLPLMKESVEHLFSRGLVKMVYATETLALGINMPARTVVIESLTKWNGSEHVSLSAGEYTQLSGRAGRRGIDTEGHAVVSASWGSCSRRGRRPRIEAHVPVDFCVHSDVQHGCQPARALDARPDSQGPGVFLRPVPGRFRCRHTRFAPD